MLIATGMRIGEVLALRWSDIELTAPPARRDDATWLPWLMVNGQITSKGKRVDHKTHAAIRPFAPPFEPWPSCADASWSSHRTTSTQSSPAATEPGTSSATSRVG